MSSSCIHVRRVPQVEGGRTDIEIHLFKVGRINQVHIICEELS
jgi:hypothetical protein